MATQGPTQTDGSIFEAGRNCWRISEAARFELIIDGAAYFRALREAFLSARKQLLLIGWDFDLEIEMLPGESDAEGNAPDGYPNALGEFIEAVVDERPDLMVYLLRWSGATLVAPGGVVPVVRLKLAGPDRIRLALDGRHPVGACHHQKIVVVDDVLAFCGGIDATDSRWDTPDHTPGDPRRVLRDGSPAPPWHDVTTAVTGPAARDLGDLARIRWERATGDPIPMPDSGSENPWPESLNASCQTVPVAIARTEPPEEDAPLVHEIEELFLDSIAASKDVIYLESQYFACDSIIDALSRKLQEADGPEIIVINPTAAQRLIEDKAMHVTRARLVARLKEQDRHGRFRIWAPVNAAEEPVYVHAKVCIIDDWLLRAGSSNIDQRSMGFDTECDVAIEGRDAKTRAMIAGFRIRLLAEHLGCAPGALERAVTDHGGLIAAVESLNRSEGRGLRMVDNPEDSGAGAILADTRALDPRYERGTERRKGFTARHFAIAVAFALACVVAWVSVRQ